MLDPSIFKAAKLRFYQRPISFQSRLKDKCWSSCWAISSIIALLVISKRLSNLARLLIPSWRGKKMSHPARTWPGPCLYACFFTSKRQNEHKWAQKEKNSNDENRPALVDWPESSQSSQDPTPHPQKAYTEPLLPSLLRLPLLLPLLLLYYTILLYPSSSSLAPRRLCCSPDLDQAPRATKPAWRVCTADSKWQAVDTDCGTISLVWDLRELRDAESPGVPGARCQVPVGLRRFCGNWVASTIIFTDY